jgi:putative oxidoreductase
VARFSSCWGAGSPLGIYSAQPASPSLRSLFSDSPLAIAEGAQSLFATDRTIAAVERLDRVKSIVQTHGNYDWLTEHGSIVILNNGIEFAATYICMLLVLFFYGAGRYLSLDCWADKWLKSRQS